MDAEERERVGARVRAARRMANMEKREDLTDLVKLPRFSAALLGQIERGQRELYEHEAEALARVLPVDTEFFYEDATGRPDESASTSQLEAYVAQILTELQALRAREQDMQALVDRQNANLAAQTRILERMQAALEISPPAEDADPPFVPVPGVEPPSHADPERAPRTRRRGGSRAS